MVKFSDKGSGWFAQPTRHRNARVDGVAGGTYAHRAKHGGSKQLKRLTYSQLKRKGVSVPPRVDSDGDGVKNKNDCRPFNPKMQDVSETTVRELELFIENDRDLYKQRYQPIQRNLARKKYNGTYDHGQAVKLMMYLVDDGARKYGKDVQGKEGMPDYFPKEDRLAVAENLVRSFESEFELGNYEEFKQKNISQGKTSISEVKGKNKQAGFHFFDKDAMRFFNSKIETKGNLIKEKYFITSEKFDYDSPRKYSIRSFDKQTGTVETVGEFARFSSYKEAAEAVKKMS